MELPAKKVAVSGGSTVYQNRSSKYGKRQLVMKNN